ncbi:MAG: hypothetical protein HY902_15945 [Deltaproteobacteria bacterium]|nr:hypothetical protein [Deltaproteobacteria bacterium]
MAEPKPGQNHHVPAPPHPLRGQTHQVPVPEAQIEFPDAPLLPARRDHPSSGYVPLAAGGTLRQLLLATLPSPWAGLAGASLAAWRLLTLHALGVLLSSSWLDLALGVAADVAVAHSMMAAVRLLSLLGSERADARGEVTRNASMAFAVLWALMMLLRLAGLVHASLHGFPISAEFWVALLRHPLATLTQGAVWVALAVAAASAALARYCMTNDMEAPEVLQDSLPRNRLLVATGSSLALAVVAVVAIHALSPGRVTSPTTSPDLTSLDSLARALQDPTLRTAPDE